MINKKQNFQTISWFWDLYNRELLDLEPQYQRRSVWNQDFKDYFIDTLLLGFPTPSIFLYEEMSPQGRAVYHVVDGKQRLTTIFEFVMNIFPVSEKAQKESFRSYYWDQLPDEIKRELWNYGFSVEYLPTTDENIIKNIFDRINRNTARLTAQELRHARFSGRFITVAEELATTMGDSSPRFPEIRSSSRRQMKDVEFVAQLLLLLENIRGANGVEQLDEAFAQRDEEWEFEMENKSRFIYIFNLIEKVVKADQSILNSRFKNQADYYSLFGALNELIKQNIPINPEEIAPKLIEFANSVDDEDKRKNNQTLGDYFNAVRFSSTDTKSRETRIQIIQSLLLGNFNLMQNTAD